MRPNLFRLKKLSSAKFVYTLKRGNLWEYEALDKAIFMRHD